MAKEFPCTNKNCDRTFSTQGALNGHQRSHNFFNFLGKQMPKEFREREREEAQIKIVMAAIKHRGFYKDAGHCDVCTVVNEVIDEPLMNSLVEYFEAEGKNEHTAENQVSAG